MDDKIAIVGIVITDVNSSEKVNAVLHGYSEYVIGRLGLPYKKKSVNVISVVLDAPQEVLNGLSGKLGMIEGVKSKIMLTK